MENTEYIKCSECPNQPATAWCNVCSELICIECVDAHRQIKTLKNHKIWTKEELTVRTSKCTNCDDGAVVNSWCKECSSLLCESCVNVHQKIKVTRSHIIKSLEDLCKELVDTPSSTKRKDPMNATSNHKSTGETEIICVNVEPNSSLERVEQDIFAGEIETIQPVVVSNSSLECVVENISAGEVDITHTVVESNKTPECVVEDESLPDTQWFNLSKVLKETADGRSILKHYHKNDTILPQHRKKLNKLVLNKTFSIKNKLTVAERQEIVKQIGLLFHKEKSSEYMRTERTQRGNRYVGIFEAAYNHRRTKVPKEASTKSKKSRDNSFDEARLQVPDGPNDDIQASMSKIQENMLNGKTLLIEWNKCFEYRMAKMPHYKIFSEICKEWPCYTRLDGFSFINDDFHQMFPESDILTSKWCDFVEFNVKTIADMINDPTAKSSLLTMNIGQGVQEKHMIFCMALHHMPVNIPTSRGFGPERWRPSVKRSKLSVFRRVYSKDSIVKAITARNDERKKNDISEHPIIYGVGEHLDEIQLFYVALGDVLYEFDSFIDALDASFKCYKVFRIRFSEESVKFWKFIESVFYDTGNSPTSHPLATVINSLNMEF